MTDLNVGVLLDEAVRSEREGDLPAAESGYRRVLEAVPDQLDVVLQLGNLLYAQGRVQEVIGHYQQALEYLPRVPQLYNNLANAFFAAGRADAAVEAYRVAIGIKPDYPDACNNLEVALKALGRLDEAAAEIARDEQVSGDSTPSYAGWRKRHELTAADRQLIARTIRGWGANAPQFHFIILCPAGGNTWLADTLDSLGGQLYPGWRLSVLSNEPVPDRLFQEVEVLEWLTVSGDPSAALDEVARASQADWLGVIEPGDRLHAKALFACAGYASRHPQCRIIYTDEDQVDRHGVHSNPQFKPDFNLELLRSTPYTGGLCMIRREVLAVMGGGGVPAGRRDFESVLRVYEAFGAAAIGHVAELLFHRLADDGRRIDAASAGAGTQQVVVDHLARMGIPARVGEGLLAGTHFVEYRHERHPLVSVIIPTKDKRNLLEACVEGLLAKTNYPNYEVLVVDNNTTEADALAYLAELPRRHPRVRVLRYEQEYNFSAINNRAADEAAGDYLLLLNNDTVIVQPNWLERMMAYAQLDDVGIVGARLVFPNQAIQHAGVILGMGANGIAEHPFLGLPMGDAGYLGRAQLAQDLSAVTGACLLIRKSLYREVGGLDQEHLKVLYNDVDLCLKIGQLGYRVVWTPFATLVHHGSASLRDGKPMDRRSWERASREVATMFERWLPKLARDPAYNRNLSLIARDYSCDQETQPRWDPDVQLLPRVMGIGAGSDGSWEHRVCIPLNLLARGVRAETALIEKYRDRVRVPSVAELERAQPDILLLHNAGHDVQLEAMENYRRFNHTFMVYGQDDLIHDMPPSNPFHNRVYKDIDKRLRRGMGCCDRLIVTTEPLAQAYRAFAGDIRVVPNYLEGAVWRQLRSHRRYGRKPRVGWAGAQQHNGDLAVVADVVRETAGEIEWVFFGMCPAEIRPLVAEFHEPVPFTRYPEKLAGLNLDLAIAPLEHNHFNEAKSNLKILEYGTLGIPVLCTDIHPYRDAPVARVANNTHAWVDAIRARINDLDSTAKEGDALQRWVQENWMLEDHLDDWLAALSPEGECDASRVSGGEE